MPDVDLGVLVHGEGISRNAGVDDMLIARAMIIMAFPSGSGTGSSTNRSMITVLRSAVMTRLKFLAAALISSVLIAAPIMAQADEHVRRHHHRHHHRHHIAWFSYIHNYGPGPIPGTYAYYDGPTSVRCKQSAAAYRGQDGRRYPCF
jgi:hypothetical protein